MASLPSSPLQIAELGSLELIARRLVEGMMTGRHRSPYRGSSVEFVEHRDYNPGDEIGHIDWRAWGRTGRYYIREFEDETNLRAHLLVDASGSMIYAGNSGALDDLPLDKIKEFETGFLRFVKENKPELRDKIRDEGEFTEAVEEALKTALNEFSASFK